MLAGRGLAVPHTAVVVSGLFQGYLAYNMARKALAVAAPGREGGSSQRMRRVVMGHTHQHHDRQAGSREGGREGGGAGRQAAQLRGAGLLAVMWWS